jgi:hypothetical protein
MLWFSVFHGPRKSWLLKKKQGGFLCTAGMQVEKSSIQVVYNMLLISKSLSVENIAKDFLEVQAHQDAPTLVQFYIQ